MGALSMQSRNYLRFSMISLAIALPVSAFAAPPINNDDARVGAPPVIVAPSRPIAPKPVQPKAPQAAIPAVPPRSSTPPTVVPPPMPRQAMNPAMQDRRVAPVQRDAGNPERAGWAQDDRRGFGGGADRAGPSRQRSAYREPSYGYQLPDDWVAPEYYISDYDSYGLSRPASGFGWSRYYDDAVLTDQWGRVYDWRDDVSWDGGYRHGGDDRGHYGDDRRGRDDRRHRDKRDRKYTYNGQWTGSWDGGPVQSYRGEWRGSVRPHWSNDGYRGHYDGGNRGVRYGGGYSQSYGYDGGGMTVTTVVVNTPAPVMTTSTVSYDVVSYVPVRKKVVRRYKPRPKAVCAC